jgi:hypothetical protein
VAELCGPFRDTLLKLRDTLLPALYSSCAAPHLAAASSSSSSSSSSSGGGRGGVCALQLDVLPWFALAGKLRGENGALLQQQDAFACELQQHQVGVGLTASSSSSSSWKPRKQTDRSSD